MPLGNFPVFRRSELSYFRNDQIIFGCKQWFFISWFLLLLKYYILKFCQMWHKNFLNLRSYWLVGYRSISRITGKMLPMPFISLFVLFFPPLLIEILLGHRTEGAMKFAWFFLFYMVSSLHNCLPLLYRLFFCLVIRQTWMTWEWVLHKDSSKVYLSPCYQGLFDIRLNCAAILDFALFTGSHYILYLCCCCSSSSLPRKIPYVSSILHFLL